MTYLTSHPLIPSLKAAGDTAKRMARHIQSCAYGHDADGLTRHMSRLADALIQDMTGHAFLNDRDILSDRHAKGRAGARERNDQRARICDMLVRLPDEYRHHLIDRIAAGGGPSEATALEQAADGWLADRLGRLNAATAVAVS